MKQRDRPAQLDIASPSEIERSWVAFTEYKSTELSTLRNKKIVTFVIVDAYRVTNIAINIQFSRLYSWCQTKKLDSHSHDE